MKKIYLSLIVIIALALNGFSQITVTGGTGAAGTYTTLGGATGAIVAINGGGALTAPVIVDVVAGHTETLTGSILLTMTGTVANTITIQKSGAGANPIITSYTGTVAASSAVASIDGMFILQGSDYVTIDGIDLMEDAANTTNITQMEVGYGLFKTSVTDGCQNVTIRNCAFSFGRASTFNGASWTGSTAIASANAVWGAVSTLLVPTALSGTNSNNTFTLNTITGGSAGIQIIGYLDATNAFCDQSNTISLNAITDYGNATTSSVHGIIISGQTGFFVNNNIIASSSTSKHAGTINGIFNANPGSGGNGTISYNVVTVHGGGTTQNIQGIRVQAGTSTATITIANNKVYNSTHTTCTSGAFFGILLTGSAGTYNIINDTITNNNIVGSATYTGIISLISVTTGTPTNVNIIANSITSNSNLNGILTGAIGAVRNMDVQVGTNVLIRDNIVDGYTRQNSVGTSTVGNLAGIYCLGGSAQCFVKHNIVNNIVYNGAGTGSPIVGIGTGISANLVVDSNTVTNLTNNKATGTSNIYGLYNGVAATNENYNYNTISNITSAGATPMYGMNFSTTAGTRTVSNNIIHTISSSGSPVSGMLQSLSTPTIFNNKIYNLSSSATGPNVTGITVSSVVATGASIYNNYIGDLRAPSATSSSAAFPSIRGINITATTPSSTFNVYYNTIHLNASSTGTLFATAGVYHTFSTTATQAALNLINNIIVNNSTPVGTGNAVALQRSASTNLNNYATTSNNNLFYAGTPGANNLIYFDGTTGYQTLATFQALVTTRETASITENPNFISLVGSSADFLHLTTSNCAMDGKGIPIAGITTDYDLQSRDAVAPDLGADEFNSTASNTLYNTVAGTTATDIRTVTGTEVFRSPNCERFAILEPNGVSPVSGSVTARVYKYATVQIYNAEPYVQRVIDITPATNAASATGRVTLYYTQQEFDDYNTASGIWPDLPTGPADAAGIANLRFTKYGGTPNVTPSLPNQYSAGTYLHINPADADIIWNATDNRWEITLDVVGFSGFYVHTNPNGILPISVNYLQGTKVGATHNLNWKVTCTSSPTATMILERSGDNRTFTAINNVTADALRCAQPFNYVDVSPLVGINYYRLKIIDANGKVTYSNTIAMANTKTGVTIVGISPNPVTSGGTTILSVASAQKGTLRLVVTDITGRQVALQSEAIIAGSNQIVMNVTKLAAGSYNVTAIMDDGSKTTVRFVKQ